MGGAKWKELPGASANSKGQVTTTNTVTDRDRTSQTTSFCSGAIISQTTTETTVFATPDEEIIVTTSTETIEDRTTICSTTKRRRRGEKTASSSSEEGTTYRKVNESSDENRPRATRTSGKGGSEYKKK